MKKLLLVLFLIPFFSLAQSEPSKGDNTIVVKSDKEGLYTEVAKQLIRNGYQIADSNTDLQLVTTEWKELRWIKQRIIIAVIDNEIHIQSKLTNEAANAVLNTGGSDWLLEYKKNGVEKEGWERLESFASYFGTDRSYFKK
jgi:uncharacterized lipoprotein